MPTSGRFAAFRESQGTDGQWPFLKRKLYAYQMEGAIHLASKGRAMFTTGGFAQEGMASCRKAIALAAGAAAYSPEDARAERQIEPVTIETLVAVRTALALAPEDALVLQLAVQDLDLDNAPAKAKGFVERVLGVAREVEANR